MTATATESADSIISRADSELKRQGIVLDDEEVLRAMDSELSGKYIPCKFSKTKGLDSPEARASAEEFEALYAKLDNTIRRVAGEMRRGRANASPNCYGGRNPCANCAAGPICRAAGKGDN